MQDAEITKSLAVHVLGGYNWLKNSQTEKQSLFLHIQVHANSQTKLWSKAQKCGVAHFTCLRLFYAMLKRFWEKIWLLCSFFGGPSFRTESEIVQSCNHAYLTVLLFLGMTLWATSWTVILSQDVLRLMALFPASFVVIGLIKRLDQSICPDFI